MIDFRGTVLLPKAKGQAIVESKQGRTEIDAHFEGLAAPQGFGLEYMTYVLWAIPPEGRPRNLGEIVAGSLADYLQRHPEIEMRCSRSGERLFYTTDSTEDFDNHAGIFYGKLLRSTHVLL